MRPGKKRVDRSLSSTRRDGGVGIESVLNQTNGGSCSEMDRGGRRVTVWMLGPGVARKRGARARLEPESGNVFFSTSNGLSQPRARSPGKERFRSAACMQGLLSRKGDPKADNQPHIFRPPPPRHYPHHPSPPHNQSSTCVTWSWRLMLGWISPKYELFRTPRALESLLDWQSLVLRSARCVARERYTQ